jgi:hypothetical protein
MKAGAGAKRPGKSPAKKSSGYGQASGGGGGGGSARKTRPPAAAAGSPSIFDRLNDTSQYTGAHKERFDKSGKGKGKAGRTQEGETGRTQTSPGDALSPIPGGGKKKVGDGAIFDRLTDTSSKFTAAICLC